MPTDTSACSASLVKGCSVGRLRNQPKNTRHHSPAAAANRKNTCRQEVVVGGWLPGAGNRTGRIGALLVGYHDDTGLRFAGKVGTGFSDAELVRLGKLFAGAERPTSPFVDKVPYKLSHFLEPTLVAEIEFTEWTHNGTLRHPSYKGLRDDKPASAVVRET